MILKNHFFELLFSFSFVPTPSILPFLKGGGRGVKIGQKKKITEVKKGHFSV